MDFDGFNLILTAVVFKVMYCGVVHYLEDNVAQHFKVWGLKGAF